MILTCANHNGPDRDAVYRMRFFDIARDSLQWTWERSTDGASTFEELWRLRYERAEVPRVRLRPDTGLPTLVISRPR